MDFDQYICHLFVFNFKRNCLNILEGKCYTSKESIEMTVKDLHYISSWANLNHESINFL